MIRFRGQNVIWPLKSVWGLRNQIYLRDPQGASKVKSSSETFKTDLRPENDLTSKVEFDFDCCVLLIWEEIWGGQNTDLTYVYMRHARYTHTRACTCMCVHARVWGCLFSIVVLLLNADFYVLTYVNPNFQRPTFCRDDPRNQNSGIPPRMMSEIYTALSSYPVLGDILGFESCFGVNMVW